MAIDIPDYIEERIHEPITDDLCILEKSTPVISFGDVSKAKVVTVGINPSSKEFYNRKKELLPKDKQRFETLKSLDIDSLEKAPIEKVRDVYQSCIKYFPEHCWSWFEKLEPFINIAVASYKNGTACHLDLVQWATNKAWSKINKSIKKKLLEKDIIFLKDQLKNNKNNIELILLNGKTVFDEFKNLEHSNFEEDLTDYFEDKNGNSTQIYQGTYLDDIKIIGWSTNLQSSRITKPCYFRFLLVNKIQELID